MAKNPKSIINDIKILLDELENLLGGKNISTKKSCAVKAKTAPKGAMGAILMLLEEGFLNKPKELSVIIEKLKEIGHYHLKQTISMNLLNLTKNRTLNRLKNKETKKWEYVVRR